MYLLQNVSVTFNERSTISIPPIISFAPYDKGRLNITFQTAFNWFSTLTLQLRKRICHRRIGWGSLVALGFAVAAFLISGFRRPVAFGGTARFVIQTHGQRDAFTRSIDFQHFHFYHVAGFTTSRGSWTNLLDRAEMCTKPS